MECGDYERVAAGMARGPYGARRGVSSALDPSPAVRRLTGADLADMDEITYWIHTKRAPCLMNYDNVIKKQNEETRSSRYDIKASDTDPSPRKKKKKRKLSLLDDESASMGKQQNVYFEVSQTNNRPMVNDCKSDSLASDLDFNIKNTSVGEKPKRGKLQKTSKPLLHKKNKVTSTPKVNTVNLRRSLRQAQLNNSHVNNSFEIFNTNGAFIKHIVEPHQTEKVQKNEVLASGDQTPNKRHSIQRNKSKNITNGQYEDYSDVSGFTANYIRSTKVQAGKTPRKLRCKPTRNLGKEHNNTNMIVCLNKSVNTGLPEPNILNCSTDSSQNVINFVTAKNNVNSNKLDKSTSLLKFMDTRAKSKERKTNGRQKSKALNISFQSQSSGTSRYPKRHRSHIDNPEVHQICTRRSNKNCLEFNNSDKKENPEERVITRTRSAALSATHRENSVLVVSNSTEQVSSTIVNMTSPPLAKQRKKRAATARHAKKTLNQSILKDTLRDKSGFAACFSESDDDSVPLVQRKFFCN